MWVQDKYNFDIRVLAFSIGISAVLYILILYKIKGNLDLLHAITLWVILGLIAYTLLSAIWGAGEWPSKLFSGWNHLQTNKLDQVKTTLTMVGGVGGVSYLVIKYRERSTSERGEADEKLLHAVQQLGENSPQVRIAGAYALADVADTYEGSYHQRVVDILCGYLRTDRLLKDSAGNTRYLIHEDGFPDCNYPLTADSSVESAILHILAAHLRTTRPNLNSSKVVELSGPEVWSKCKLDLHGATLTEPVNLSSCYIGSLYAQDATLFNQLSLSSSHIDGHTFFYGATFKQEAEFKDTHFEFPAVFDFVKFEKDVYFNRAIFSYKSSFECTKFTSSAWFEDASFNLIGFIKSRFYGDAHFRGVNPSVPLFYNSEFHQIADFSTKSSGAKTPRDYDPNWIQNRDLYCCGIKKKGPGKADEIRFTFDGAKFNSTFTENVAFPKYDKSLFIDGFPPKEAGLPLGAGWKEFNIRTDRESQPHKSIEIDEHMTY